MAELVYARGLEPRPERVESSSLSLSTLYGRCAARAGPERVVGSNPTPSTMTNGAPCVLHSSYLLVGDLNGEGCGKPGGFPIVAEGWGTEGFPKSELLYSGERRSNPTPSTHIKDAALLRHF